MKSSAIGSWSSAGSLGLEFCAEEGEAGCWCWRTCTLLGVEGLSLLFPLEFILNGDFEEDVWYGRDLLTQMVEGEVLVFCGDELCISYNIVIPLYRRTPVEVWQGLSTLYFFKFFILKVLLLFQQLYQPMTGIEGDKVKSHKSLSPKIPVSSPQLPCWKDYAKNSTMRLFWNTYVYIQHFCTTHKSWNSPIKIVYLIYF